MRDPLNPASTNLLIDFPQLAFSAPRDDTARASCGNGAKANSYHPVINPAGELPDGRAFKDANEFKQRLLEDRDMVARAFIEHLCSYGLRRVLTFDDQDDLNAIQAEAKKSNYQIKDIVRAVAMSELMRKR